MFSSCPNGNTIVSCSTSAPIELSLFSWDMLASPEKFHKKMRTQMRHKNCAAACTPAGEEWERSFVQSASSSGRGRDNCTSVIALTHKLRFTEEVETLRCVVVVFVVAIKKKNRTKKMQAKDKERNCRNPPLCLYRSVRVMSENGAYARKNRAV